MKQAKAVSRIGGFLIVAGSFFTDTYYRVREQNSVNLVSWLKFPVAEKAELEFAYNVSIFSAKAVAGSYGFEIGWAEPKFWPNY